MGFTFTSNSFVSSSAALPLAQFSAISSPAVLLHGAELSHEGCLNARQPCFFVPHIPRVPHSHVVLATSSSPSSSNVTSDRLAGSVSGTTGTYKVGDFMTKKEDLLVVKTSTPVNEALETLVRRSISGFPVVDNDWNLVGVVSDYDLLALDSISGACQNDTTMFPEVNKSWKAFREIQKQLSKTNSQVVGDLMTPTPLVVTESSKLEDAAKLLLATKYRRLPVVDGNGKLVGLITRGTIVRAGLMIKRSSGGYQLS